MLVDGTNVLRSTFVGDVPPPRGPSGAYEARRKLQVQMEQNLPSNSQKELLEGSSLSKLPRAAGELYRYLTKKQYARPKTEIIRIGNSKIALVLDAPAGSTAKTVTRCLPPA